MSTPAPAMLEKPSAARVIFEAGLMAGVLDITYVIVFFGFSGVPAERILKGIAAAVLGRAAALQGGWGVAALGLGIHLYVALSAAAVFYALSRRLTFLTGHALLSGVGYGVLVWFVMNLVVLPLTATPPKSFPPPQWVAVFIAHLVCVGPPIALVVRRHAK